MAGMQQTGGDACHTVKLPGNNKVGLPTHPEPAGKRDTWRICQVVVLNFPDTIWHDCAATSASHVIISLCIADCLLRRCWRVNILHSGRRTSLQVAAKPCAIIDLQTHIASEAGLRSWHTTTSSTLRNTMMMSTSTGDGSHHTSEAFDSLALHKSLKLLLFHSGMWCFRQK